MHACMHVALAIQNHFPPQEYMIIRSEATRLDKTHILEGDRPRAAGRWQVPRSARGAFSPGPL